MTDTAVAASPEPEDRNLPAERQQHPIIAAIDGRMDEIGGILPDGMKPERFRKVVVQAMLRTPGLWDCTPISIITAITEAAEVGIEPTGVLGKGWLIPYRGEAKFIPGWRGFVDLCWRADRLLLTPELVRQGDGFEYRRGTGQYLHHVPVLDDPDREVDDNNVTFAYVIVRFPDGREDFEVMSRAALDRIRDVSLSKIRDLKKREQAIWNVHPGEMMKKTPVRRIAKRLPLSPAVQAMLGRDEEIDYDTPVERVADPKRDGLRDRIRQRTAAVRGESTEESEAGGAIVAGGAEPGETSSSPPAAPRKGDPWMARLHAVGAERGMDHDALHDWAVEHFGVQSLTDLSPPQRATFMELVERMEIMPTSAPPAADQDAPASAGAAEEARSAAAPNQTPEDDRSTMAADPATAAGSGGEGVPAAASSEPAPATIATPLDPGSAGPRAGEDERGKGRTPPAEAQTAGQPDRSALTRPEPHTFTDPAALETYAAAVLGFEEPQPLKDLTPAEFDQVWSALGLADLDAYRAWYPKQERAVRAALMTAKQSPTARRDAAKDAAKAKPDADQLRASLTEGDA